MPPCLGKVMMLNRKQEKQQPATDAHGVPAKLPAVHQSTQLRFLAYALPRMVGDTVQNICSGAEFDLHDVPTGANPAFPDFDGVVVFAGAFEELSSTPVGSISQCVNPVDLDQRERQFFTMVGQGHPFVFLLPFLPDPTRLWEGGNESDLFRRVASKLKLSWQSSSTPHPALISTVPEFDEFISSYGTGYVSMTRPAGNSDTSAVICSYGDDLYGMVLYKNIFLLPCAHPQTHKQAVDMASAATAAVIAYRRRVSRELPTWVGQFAFEHETKLVAEVADHRRELQNLDAKIDTYKKFKGALCLQSDPLVGGVEKIMNHFFGVHLVVDDEKKIEDATIRDSSGNIIAVVEIKGINSNFDRKLVNQIDGHRERLKLPTSIPGIAIVNTFRSADSLTGKDQSPNREIIGKAVQDNVLLIRTLDLLRFANLVEQGIKTKAEFQNILLKESGWLKVDDNSVTVVKE